MSGHAREDGGEKRQVPESVRVRSRLAGWKLAAVPTAVVAGFFVVDLAADLIAGVSALHLGLDVVALLVALLCLGGALRKR